MRLEIVVSRSQGNGAVDFEKGLTVLIRLLHEPVLHAPNMRFGLREFLAAPRL
jgi:hypothetical protein